MPLRLAVGSGNAYLTTGLNYLQQREITEIAILQLSNDTHLVFNTDILCEMP